MPFTRQQAYRTLAALKPGPVFLQSYESKRLPENLDIYFGPPEEFFIASDTQEIYTQGQRIPILDDGNFSDVLFYDPVAQTLIELNVETPKEGGIVYQHWQQYLASMMIRIAESIDDDESVRRTADIVQFLYTKELFDFFNRSEHLKGHDWWGG